jgi:hypothetical protein
VSGRVHASAIGCITVPLLLLALVPLAWGARARWSDGVLLRNGATATGRVVDVRFESMNPTISSGLTFRSSGRRTSGRKGVTPVVEFTTAAGERRTMVGSVNRVPPDFAAGDAAEVVYDPANPSRADVRVELERWGFWCGFWSAIGAALAALAYVPLWLVKRSERLG